MKKLLLVLLLTTGLAARAAAGPVSSTCPNCIFNTAAPQVAQINIGTATIQGTITATTGTFQYINLQNLTVTNISGNGSNLTNLNASQLTSGTVPAARLSGAYTGITAVGTITSGIWNGQAIGTQYGGSGQDFSTANQGSLIYFSATGVESILPPGPAGYLLQTNGAAQNPTYTNSPQITGSNITAIPLTALQAGTLPTNIVVLDASIATISGSKVTGNIPGGAASLTSLLPISGIQPGTLPTTIAASSITDTGVTAGVYGNPGYVPQITVRTDGRLNAATQLLIAITPSQITAGLLPGGVTVNPSAINAGTLGVGVVAQTLTATGVTPGTYGTPTQSAQITVDAEGRITSATQLPIPGISTSAASNNVDNAWQHAQTSFSSWTINANMLVTGTLTAGFFVGDGSGITNINPANISAGSLGPFVIASSIAANGITAGSCGDATHSCTITFTSDGRAVFQSSVSITGVPAASVAAENVLPGFLNSGVKLSTANVVPGFNGADEFVQMDGSGNLPTINGQNVTNINPANLSAGTLPANVIASSVAATGVAAGSYGSASSVGTFTVGGDGRLSAAASVTISLTNANLQAGTYSNVSIPAANVNAGTLGAAVIASSVAATAVTAGAYGSATQVGAFTVAGDGRLTAAANITVTPAAASITAGTLGASVIASSVGANGVTPGTCGGATSSCSLTITADGRITVQSNVAITGSSPGGAAGGVLAGTYPNPTFGPQVVLSTHIANGAVGDAQTTLSTAAIISGKFGDNRVAISTAGVTSGKFGDDRVAISTAGVVSGKFGDDRVAITTGAITSGFFTSGVSSSCAAGFYWDNGHWTRGQTDGGACVAAGTGGGGSSTATVVGQLDTFTSQCNGVTTSFTLSAVPVSSGSIWISLDGVGRLINSDWTYTPPQTVTFATAPASGCRSLWAQYLVATSTASYTPLNVMGSNIPIWIKYTVPYTSFSVAYTTADVQLLSLPAKTVVEAVVIKQSAAFTGGAISAYTLSVGITGGLDKYASAFDVFQVASSSTAQASHDMFVEDFTSATSIRIAATSTGANLNAATAGSVDVWVQTSTLP